MSQVRRIGRYEILEELGRGGFATVYKARDARLDRLVALKVLHPYWREDPGFAERFQREARAAANLRHPGIVTIHEADEAHGQLYIAMEYLPGRSLKELLSAEGALPLERALPILDQIADALDYAHEQGVVHRDVKPGNILVEDTPRGKRATLLDFGLVKALQTSTALTSHGTLLGSPEYMAPEQADPNRAAEVGPAADRYALGIVAYQMLTGRVPFPGNTPATLNAHEHKPVPPPRSLRPGLPPHVEAALLKMLAKTPTERFPTCAAFAGQLRADRPIPEPIRRQAVRQASTTRWRIGRVLVLCMLLFGILGPWARGCTPQATPENPNPEAPLFLGVDVFAIILSSDLASSPQPVAQAILFLLPVALTLLFAVTLAVLIGWRSQRARILRRVERVVAGLALFDLAIAWLLVGAAFPLLWGFWLSAAGVLLAPLNLLGEWLAARRPRWTWIAPALVGALVLIVGIMALVSSPNQTGPTGRDFFSQPIVTAAPQTQTRYADGMVMVYVPGGSFQMGSNDGSDDEQPVHDVTLDSFYIDRTEVTNAQYARCVDAGKCSAPSQSSSYTRDSYYRDNQYADYPVIWVSWYDANDYCTWADAQLPAEAQWEYAARGSEGRKYPWGDESPSDQLLNYNGNVGDTSEVGSYPAGASWVGALDMAGNVWEWVADWYGSYPSEPQESPTGPSSGEFRVLRGGGWGTNEYNVRAASRNPYTPDYRDAYLGFRCVSAGPGE